MCRRYKVTQVEIGPSLEPETILINGAPIEVRGAWLVPVAQDRALPPEDFAKMLGLEATGEEGGED